MFSRERVAGERVKAPRHFVLYRRMNEKVEFARLLHDSRDLARHVRQALKTSNGGCTLACQAASGT